MEYQKVVYQILQKYNQKKVIQHGEIIISEDKKLGAYFATEDMLVDKEHRHEDTPENRNKLKKFISKVVDYLFNDVTKFDHNTLFKEKITFDHWNKKDYIRDEQFKEYGIRFSGRGGLLMKGFYQVDIEKDGKDLLIGFNPKFFIDALRVIEEEEVSLYMVNPKAPCFIKDDAGKFIYLILPVNFSNVN